MKCYLSGPMTGYPKFNYPLFKSVAHVLRKADWVVVSPHETDDDELRKFAEASPDGNPTGSPVSWGDCLAKDVKLIADGGIDAMMLLEDWGLSRGACLEAMVGLQNPKMQFYEVTELIPGAYNTQEIPRLCVATLIHSAMIGYEVYRNRPRGVP